MLTFADAMSKKKSTTVERMLFESNLRQSIEQSLRTEDKLSDMERQDYINQINDLKGYVKQLLDMIDTLKQTLDTVSASNRRNEELVKKLTSQIEELQRMIKNLEDKNRRHNKNTFGKKTHKAKKKAVENKPLEPEEKSRDEEKEDYDGSHDSSEGTPAASERQNGSAEGKLDMTKVKSEGLDGKRGPRGPYKKMDAAKVTTLLCDISHIPAGMRFKEFREHNEFNKVSYVECVSYQIAILVDESGNEHEYFVPADEALAAGRLPKTEIVPGTHGTINMVCEFASDMYQMLIPNYRETIRMRIDKFVSCDNTRMNWLKKAFEFLKPMLGFIKIKLLKAGSFLNIDETWARQRIKIKGDGTKLGHYFKKYVWVLLNKLEGMIYFLYDNDENDSRGTRPIDTFLGDYKGAIMSDAYIVYRQLVFEHPDLIHCLCWSHVHNKFELALEISKEEDAAWFVNMINYLYLVENECIIAELTPEKVKERREKKDVTDTLLALQDRARKLLLKKGNKYSDLMVTALNYMLNGWNELQNYRKDGRFTIDNLPAERAIRPLTVKRKQSLHHSSEEGMQMALGYMTIIGTASLLGYEAKDFLARALHTAIYGDNDLESMLQPAVITK